MSGVYRLSVRQAVELLCQEGDLSHRDRDTATAQEGQEAHRRVQSAWEGRVDSEVTLKHSFTVPASASEHDHSFTLTLKGRIDGLQRNGEILTLFEIKTLRHDPDVLPAGMISRHRLQLLLYAALYLLQPEHRESPPEHIVLKRVYVNVLTDEIAEQSESAPIHDLGLLTDPLIAHLLDWYSDLHQHRLVRDQALSALAFPYPEFRPGQRDLAAMVYRTLRDNGQALIEAPTGSGKSLATLFPALKATGAGLLDQIIVTSAKNASQQAALDSVRLLDPGKILRTLQLSARDKICQPDSVCTPDDCPRQTGFFERLPAALEDALREGLLSAEKVREIALQHELCPHGLQSALQPWVDVLIGDYNYVFSPNVRQDMVFSMNRVGLLIDEAHNLPDRARELFSAKLDNRLLKRCLQSQNTTSSPLSKSCRALIRSIEQVTPDSQPADQIQKQLRRRVETFVGCAEHWLAMPQDLISVADRDTRQVVTDALQQARQWLIITERDVQDFICLTDQADTESRASTRILHWRCLSPASQLKPLLAATRAAILFSATLTPPDFYETLLGTDTGQRRQRLTSPFDPQNSRCLLVPYLNLRSRNRHEQIPDVVRLIADTFHARPGNYWVFSPSYDYQTRLAALFAETWPDIDVLTQPAESTTSASEQFLDAFRHKTRRIGFTVLGGVFGESIDLVGDRLIGSIILGPGLPQKSRINEAIADYFRQRNLDGFAYAYQLPGWQRVVQAAGRVIRTERDQGIMILVDDRFQQPFYRALFPPHWQTEIVSDPAQLSESLARFWTDSGYGGQEPGPGE